MYTSTIRAYQHVLATWKFKKSNDYAEEFAQKRFLKKLEVPNSDTDIERADRCFSDWLARDDALPGINGLLHPTWYKARHRLHQVLRDFRMGVPQFTPGSTFYPTRGRNSVEAKLVGTWTCTPGNFDLFAKLSYGHAGLKRAVRKKFRSSFETHSAHKAACIELYERYRDIENTGFACYCDMLQKIVTLEQGSRFSTVPKNNEKDRPINVECVLNSLTQAAISEGIETVLKNRFNLDLSVTQNVHRQLIADSKWSTIDLSNASDSMSVSFLEWLLPPWFFDLLDQSRAFMILGLDGNYYVTKKMCCMGNGWCFSLMTLVLLALVRALDDEGSVYGDDIIISNAKANDVITCLSQVGFVVNEDKSFISSSFRESCGANYLDGYGYIKSFDFWWPETIADCMRIFNKVQLLSEYPSFQVLGCALSRLTPDVLRGGTRFLRIEDFYKKVGWEADDDLLSEAFWAAPVKGRPNTFKPIKDFQIEAIKTAFCLTGKCRFFKSFKWVPAERSAARHHLTSKLWAKYLMYLASGRRSQDVITSQGRWVEVAYISIGGYQMKLASALQAIADHRGA